MSALELEWVKIRADRMVLGIRVRDPRLRYTTPAIARRALELRPLLAEHACVNDRGAMFRDAIARTSLPHLLEHLIIDLQAQRAKDPARVFTGLTSWTRRDAGLAQVEVSFESDLGALAVLRDALSLLERIVG